MPVTLTLTLDSAGRVRAGMNLMLGSSYELVFAGLPEGAGPAVALVTDHKGRTLAGSGAESQTLALDTEALAAEWREGERCCPVAKVFHLWVAAGGAVLGVGDVIMQWSPMVFSPSGLPVSFQGAPGRNGADGASAYELWLAQGNTGTAADFFASFNGRDGADGRDGRDGRDGVDGARGAAGASAYEVWLAAGHSGGAADFLNFLKSSVAGPKGDKGDKGDAGAKGADGADGRDGRDGKDGAAGAKGADGASAYQCWLDDGGMGSTADFIASLKGAPGDSGADGAKGERGDKGDKGDKGDSGADGTNGKDGRDGKNGKDGINGKDGGGKVIYHQPPTENNWDFAPTGGGNVDILALYTDAPPNINTVYLQLYDYISWKRQDFGRIVFHCETDNDITLEIDSILLWGNIPVGWARPEEYSHSYIKPHFRGTLVIDWTCYPIGLGTPNEEYLIYASVYAPWEYIPPTSAAPAASFAIKLDVPAVDAVSSVAQPVLHFGHKTDAGHCVVALTGALTGLQLQGVSGASTWIGGDPAFDGKTHTYVIDATRVRRNNSPLLLLTLVAVV